MLDDEIKTKILEYLRDGKTKINPLDFPNISHEKYFEVVTDLLGDELIKPSLPQGYKRADGTRFVKITKKGKRFLAGRRRNKVKQYFFTLEDSIKEHPLVSICVTALIFSIISPILVQLFIWNFGPSEVTQKEVEPFIFANKEIIPLEKDKIYTIRAKFSIYNPTEQSIIISNKYVRLPRILLLGESLDLEKPIIRNVGEDIKEAKTYLTEVEPKATVTTTIIFNVNTSTSGLYPITYCIRTPTTEICSEETYLQLNITA